MGLSLSLICSFPLPSPFLCKNLLATLLLAAVLTPRKVFTITTQLQAALPSQFLVNQKLFQLQNILQPIFQSCCLVSVIINLLQLILQLRSRLVLDFWPKYFPHLTIKPSFQSQVLLSSSL